MNTFLISLKQNKTLSFDQAYQFANTLLSGKFDEAIAREILVLLYKYGETKETILGMSQSLQDHAKTIPGTYPLLVDTCGTGGSGLKRFNTSTLLAFVLATLDVPIAKHGNRSSHGRCGSFDLLEHLGIEINQTPKHVAQSIETHNIGFIYARSFHPAMKHVAALRKSIPHRTIFNILGPLSSPAPLTHHLLGVSELKLQPLLAECLAKKGINGMVVHGHNGLDDITITDTTSIHEVQNGNITSSIFDPEHIGIKKVDDVEVQGGDKETNALIFHSILSGKDTYEAIINMICINAAAILKSIGRTDSWEEGVAHAKEVISNGKVQAKFQAAKGS